MNRTRLVAVALVLSLCIGGLAAQDQPDIAYRMLSAYVDKKEADGTKGLRIGGSVAIGLGGLLVAGAATTWYAGDYMARCDGSPAGMDPDIKLGMTMGMGLGGLVLSSVGTSMLFAKPHDFRLEYAEVFQEDDRQIREALAVAVLRDLSIKGQNRRVQNAMFDFLVPVLTAALQVGFNLANDKEWSDGVLGNLSSSAWSIVGGITSLCISSEEERLYAKYLAGRDALYGGRGTTY